MPSSSLNPAVNPGNAQTNRGNQSQNPRVRQADGTVQKASMQATTGPQSGLRADPYDLKDLRFPLNIGLDTAPKRLHWVRFTPCIQQKSEYKVTQGYDSLTPSQSDVNRAGGAGAGAINPFGNAVGTGLEVAGILGTINGVAAGSGAVKSAITNLAKEDFAAAFSSAVGGAVSVAGAAAGAAFAGVVVSNIDLSRKTKRAAMHICLYMPDTVNVQQVNNYDQVSLTQALGKAGIAAQAGDSIAGQLKDFVGSAKKINTGAGGGGIGNAGGVAEVAGILAEKTGNFGAGIGDVLLFSAGLAQNPQIELLFKNISNREFQFDFKFVPTSPAEADAIRKIIKAFRFYAAPEISSNGKGRYFIPPSEFDIEFMLGSDQNKNLPQISSCILEGIDVNFGSAGQWTAFQDGMPVEISMQLRFKETEIMHKKLIESGY